MTWFDPNAGQADDERALGAMRDSLAGWNAAQFVTIGFDPGVAALDLLVDLPRRGWRLVSIDRDPAAHTHPLIDGVVPETAYVTGCAGCQWLYENGRP